MERGEFPPLHNKLNRRRTMKTDILDMYDNLKRDYDSLLKEQGSRDYDEWDYFEDPDSGIGIVVNHFRDGGDPLLNVYVVPKNKVANNNWHSDMEDITYTVPGEEN
jgi:hypothetical protein